MPDDKNVKLKQLRAESDAWSRHYKAAWWNGFGTACGIFLVIASVLIFALTHLQFH